MLQNNKVKTKAGIIISILLLVACLDHATKLTALYHLSLENISIEVSSFLNFVLVFNPGISFGFLGDGGETQRILLTLFATIVGCSLTFWAFLSKKTTIKISLSMIAGGALGNAIDRILYGAVVDFIDFHYKSYHWPAFNIADAAITIGVAIVIIDELLSRS